MYVAVVLRVAVCVWLLLPPSQGYPFLSGVVDRWVFAVRSPHRVDFRSVRHPIRGREVFAARGAALAPSSISPSRQNGEFRETTVDTTAVSAGEHLWELVKFKPSVRALYQDRKLLIVNALDLVMDRLSQDRSLEEQQQVWYRFAGAASILGSLDASAEMILAGVVHEVLPEMDSQLRCLVGNDTVELSYKFKRFPHLDLNRSSAQSTFTNQQAENQLQMLVTLAEDYRVLFLRLAERLVTLREAKKSRSPALLALASEALQVYAPLAHRMGAVKIKSELEGLAFQILYPEIFRSTHKARSLAHFEWRRIVDTLQQLFSTDSVLRNATVRISHRVKDAYQVFLKMRRKGFVHPIDVNDILGLRIVVEKLHEPWTDPARQTRVLGQLPRPNRCRGEVGDMSGVEENGEAAMVEGEEMEPLSAGGRGGRRSPRSKDDERQAIALCYHIASRLSDLVGWEVLPHLGKDYIARRKDSGYASLHLFIRSLASRVTMEVQIRTHTMHKLAEVGLAAHWHYKDRLYRPEVANSRLYHEAWRSREQLLAENPGELMVLAKRQLEATRVFVVVRDFTGPAAPSPVATVLNLEKGATVGEAVKTWKGSRADREAAIETILVNDRVGTEEQRLASGDVLRVVMRTDADDPSLSRETSRPSPVPLGG